jgi:diacylglycerol kinase family enzyme
MPTLLIFANPISGSGRGKKIAHRLQQRLTREGYSVVLHLQRPDEIAADEIPPDATAAIIIGGDGTLRAVASRLIEKGSGFRVQGSETDDHARKSDWRHPSLNQEPRTKNPPPSSSLTSDLQPLTSPPLLLIPMGTANLMGKHLGIAWDAARVEDQVLAALRHGRVVNLDTASANGQLLLIVAGIGLDATVVHALAKRRSGPISYLSYALPVLAAVGQYEYPPLSVTVDGKKVFGPAPAMVFIGNVSEYGTGFPLLPLASPTDGVLDVCVLPCRSREELFSLVLRAAVGEHLHGEEVVYIKGRRIRVESPNSIPVQIDGEAAGHTPLDIDLLPARLGFIVPGT